MTAAITHRKLELPGPRKMRRYGILPLEEALEGGDLYMRQASGNKNNEHLVMTAYVALACGVSRSLAHRWRREGLTIWSADRAATAIGLHPTLIWPDWGWEAD